MNIVKFYRERGGGAIEVARVKVCQSRDRYSDLMGRGKAPSLASAERFMCGRGWSRKKPKRAVLVPRRSVIATHLALRAMG